MKFFTHIKGSMTLLNTFCQFLLDTFMERHNMKNISNIIMKLAIRIREGMDLLRHIT